MVYLDNVPFPRSSRGTWVNRVRLAQAGRAYWVTAPIRRVHGEDISQVWLDQQAWRGKLLRTLQLHYGRAPHFQEIFEVLAGVLECSQERLSEWNIQAIEAILAGLGFRHPQPIRASQLGCSGSSNQLLVNLVKACGGTHYLAGQIALETYQQNERFEEQGVKVLAQNFQHPSYPQWGNSEEMLRGLSIVDCLMNIGWKNTRELLR